MLSTDHRPHFLLLIPPHTHTLSLDLDLDLRSIGQYMAAEGVRLNHIARETSDVKRLAAFYEEVLGFHRLEAPKFRDFEVIWLHLPPSFSLHIIERDPKSKLPEGPFSASGESVVADPKDLPRGHHVAFDVSNFDAFVQALKDKGIETFQKTQPDGKTKQAFFCDPDGNGLEARSY